MNSNRSTAREPISARPLSRVPMPAPAPLAWLFAVLVVVGGAPLVAPAGASTIVCGTPGKGGSVQVKIRSTGAGGCPFDGALNIPIPMGIDGARKAEIIDSALTANCSAYKITRSDSTLTITEKNGNGIVTVTFVDYTSETHIVTNGITTPGGLKNNAAGYRFDLLSPGSGTTPGGGGPGGIQIGTSRYVSTIPTSPGESPMAMLSAAQADLNAHGIGGVLADLGGGQAGIYLQLADADTSITFGSFDGAANDGFQMIPFSQSADYRTSLQALSFCVPPGMQGASTLLDGGSMADNGDVCLYGYDPTMGWVLEKDWRWTTNSPFSFASTPQITSYQFVAHGNQYPLSGNLTLSQAPVSDTPSSAPILPDFSLGWLGAPAGTFNPNLGVGGGTPNVINIQPGLPLQTVPEFIGANHWQYIPLQMNVQPDPSRPWLYMGGNPSQPYQQPTYVSIFSDGLFDPTGNRILSLPLQVQFVQGPLHLSFPVNATDDGNGNITIPPIDLGPILAQPYSLAIGVPGTPAPAAVVPAGTAGIQTLPGYISLQAIGVTVGLPSSAGVNDTPRPVSALQFAAPSPNPSRSATRLAFATPAAGHVRVAIYDMQGREVRSLVNGPLGAGAHSLTWDGRDTASRPVPGGMYFARVETGDGAQTRKIALLR